MCQMSALSRFAPAHPSWIRVVYRWVVPSRASSHRPAIARDERAVTRPLIVLVLVWIWAAVSTPAFAQPAEPPPAEPESPDASAEPNAPEAEASEVEPKPEPEPAVEPEPTAEAPADSAEPEPTPEAPSPEPAPPHSEDDTIRERARNIRALVDGDLDPLLEAQSLFVLDLTDPRWAGGAGLRFDGARERALAPAPTRKRRRSRRRVALADLAPDAALELALREFYGLAPHDRLARFEDHATRRADAEIRAERDAAQELADQTHADQLRAYLTGTLELNLDPVSLLRFDLLETSEAALDPKVRIARADLDLQRRRFLALAPAERDALAQAHATRIAAAEAKVQAEAEAEAEAKRAAKAAAAAAAPDAESDEDTTELEEALAEKERAAQARKAASESLTDAEAEASLKAAAREAALETARKADTKAKRVIAQERARLLGIQEDQANFEAALARRRVERAEDHDRVLDWNLRLTTLAESPKFESEVAAEADPMYKAIREDLAVLRTRLSGDLERLRDRDDQIPGVGTPLDSELPADTDRGDVSELRAEVAKKEKELSTLAEEIGWELASQTRDDVVALNTTRLRLLDLASPDLRRAVTSFGSDGVDQAKREFKQMSLEFGFFLQSLPRHRAQFFDELVNSTVQVALGLLKLAALILAFVWWRRRGTEILEKLEAGLRERRPMTPAIRFSISAVWYLRRIRRPLVVLAVVWGLLYVIDGIAGIPNLNLVWIAAKWVLLGLAAVLLVDALAARERLYSASKRDNSALRIHSLRVIGANIIAVGMVLALTAAMVGRGALYSWVLSTCWILSFPVAIYLVHHWKPIIFELVGERPEQTAFTRWVTGQRSGLSSFPAAAAGAGYLLAMGSGAWIMRQLSGLEVTRRLLAYLFRRELAKQAAATEADERYRPIEKKVRPHFDPEIIPTPLLTTVGTAELERVSDQLRSGRRTLTAIVGEKGAGKSVFIRRLQESMDGLDIHCVSCPEEGAGSLLADLAKIAGKPNAEGQELVQAMRSLGRCVIVVDDLQRLVIPAVNGLRGLDTFTDFSREVGGGISWVVTIGSAAWQYIRRARGDRVSFEQIVQLPGWSEDTLGELIKGQCEKAEIEPSFEGLVVPRQSEPLPDQGDRTEASYYRLLWDFSKGNPAVALHAFRESLFRDEEGGVVVRLFKEPPAEEIEALSLSQLFILRTVVQLELALTHEIARATQLPFKEVEDAMRFCSSRGYVEKFQGGYRMTWPWYRTITTVLQRQHLLSSL